MLFQFMLPQSLLGIIALSAHAGTAWLVARKGGLIVNHLHMLGVVGLFWERPVPAVPRRLAFSMKGAILVWATTIIVVLVTSGTRINTVKAPLVLRQVIFAAKAVGSTMSPTEHARIPWNVTLMAQSMPLHVAKSREDGFATIFLAFIGTVSGLAGMVIQL
ncbi:MAG: hypothetical protein M1836_006095 [Candelina mexicana]|nr:MAG: hypothetical protein M1836_006095 [Candelina mexicana]